MKVKNPTERKIRLKSLNQFITCRLCCGYLINATTITECLHTFCRSCIVLHLNSNVHCPTCSIVIHQSYPKSFISHDRTMQAIVAKLVPNINEIQFKRQKEFYENRNLPLPDSLTATTPSTSSVSSVNTADEKKNSDNHKADEQVLLYLESEDKLMEPLHRPYMRVSAFATISNIKKYVVHKLIADSTLLNFHEVDILCNDEILGKDHTLKFINATRWCHKDPLKLLYRKKLNL